jgi:peptide-methionine (S)-S-oxide reductase
VNNVNLCPTPRAVAGWIAMALVMVTGVGIMAAWIGQSPTRAMASTNVGDDGAPEPAASPAESATTDAKDQGEAQEEPVTETATFAAGCFWGVQVAFDRTPGVVSTSVGFMGGEDPNVTYKEVCTKDTGHAEVVHLTFDPAKVSYEELVRVFFRAHDPTTLNRQGPDVGTQYRSAIFYHSDAQKEIAEKSKAAMQASAEFREVFGTKKIVTEIAEAGPYIAAEDYHQKYFEKRGATESCHRGW